MNDREIVLKLIVDGKEAILNLQLTNEQLDNLKSNINQFANQSQRASKELTNTTASSKDMQDGIKGLNMAMGQFGYVLNDAQVFLINFRMGLMGISNNIPMIISLFSQAREKIEAAGGSIKQGLVAALSGPGGLMIAINGVMLLLNLLPSLFSKTTESIEDQKEAVDKLRDSYQKLTRVEIENRLKSYELQLQEIEAKYPKVKVPLGKGQYAGTVLREQTEEERFGADLARVQVLRQQIEVLKEINRDLGIQEDIEKRIRINREKLEKMNENPESKNYWKKLVPNATDYQNARDLLNKWIEADQKIFRKEKDSTKTSLIKPGKEEPMLRPINIEGEPEIDVLSDVKFMDELELRKLKAESIQDEFARKRELADWELEMQLRKFQDYENFEEIKTELFKQHANTRMQIDREEQEFKLNNLSQTLSSIKGLFGEHTAAYKAITIFQTLIDTYQAATAAYKSTAEIPLIGPILAPISAAAASAFGLGQVASIEKTQVPGYAKGGFGIVGENGVEVIAPLRDYAQGQAELVNQTLSYLERQILQGRLPLSGQLSDAKLMNENIKMVTKAIDEIKSWQKQVQFKILGEDLVTVSEKFEVRRLEFEY